MTPPKFGPQDLMTILEGIDDGVIKLDPGLKYEWMNQAAGQYLRRLGRDPDLVIGKSVWEVFPELKDSVVASELHTLTKQQVPVTFEVLFPPEPPDQRWYETKAYPSREGVIIVFHDITARKADKT